MSDRIEGNLTLENVDVNQQDTGSGWNPEETGISAPSKRTSSSQGIWCQDRK